MFSFFKKQPETQSTNPIADAFAGTSTKQKQSLTNLLLIVSTCSDEQPKDSELKMLNTLCDMLGVRGGEAMTYLKQYGPPATIADLKTLSDFQKEMLITSVDNMMRLSPLSMQKKLPTVVSILGEIGISQEKFLTTVEKNRALYKHMMG